MKTLRPTAAARIDRWQALCPQVKAFVIAVEQGKPMPAEEGWVIPPRRSTSDVTNEAILAGYVSADGQCVTAEFRTLYLDLFGVNPYGDAAELEDYRTHRGDLIEAVSKMVEAEEDGSGYWNHILEVLNR